jgi:transcription initiation factor TFIID TATA-box-binding protein
VSKKPSVTIVNVVASAQLNQQLGLSAILKLIPSSVYKPERFTALVYRFKRPKTSTLIFRSGKLICTGSKSEKQAKHAIVKIIKQLKEHGVVTVEVPNITITNIVASIDLGGCIDLEASVTTLKKIMYEPEQFPGLIYRMDEPKVVMLLFTSGKTVCAGARKEEDVATAGNMLQKILESKNLISYE